MKKTKRHIRLKLIVSADTQRLARRHLHNLMETNRKNRLFLRYQLAKNEEESVEIKKLMDSEWCVPQPLRRGWLKGRGKA